VQRRIEKIRASGVTDFRAFFLGHPDELIACVQEINVLDVNAATLALMHATSKEQLIGGLKQVVNIKPDMDFVDELVNIAEGRTEFSWDGINYTVDGQKLFISLHWSVAPGYEKTLEKVMVSVLDVSARKQAEDAIRQLNASLEQRVEARTRELRQAQQQLVHQEKLATLGQLAGGVGHELRNPLGVINSAVYYLKLVQPDVDEKIKKYHLIIEQEVNTASRIISDLLDFGRIVTPDRQPVSVPALLPRVLARFPLPPLVQLQLKLPEGLPKVYADPLHLEQVLGNLITNACQAMKDCADGGILTISASLKKNQVAIAVKDTGTGISPEAMQRLFEPLYTTKLRGIGLGLAVSKKLAEANGGRITVRSTPGRGSTFTLFLPVKDS
jgi:signal transduction histidine kinase